MRQDGVTPPYNQLAEENVVGACLLGGSTTVTRAAEVVESEQFYVRSLGTIFSACLSVVKHGAPPDVVTVEAELRRTGEIDEVGGQARLVELLSQTASAANVQHHARIVRDQWYQREQFFIGKKLIDVSTNGGLTSDLTTRIGKMLLPRYDGRHSLEALALDELLSGPAPVVPWTWAEWIGLHTLVVVAGAPGVGKSYLMLALALHIRRGIPFLGAETSQGRCGIVDLENSKGVVHRRLHSLGMRPGETDGLFYSHMPELTITERDGIQAIDATVVENSLDFLVLDSFRRLTPGLNENDSGEVSAVLQPLKQIVEARECTIVIIHHARKRGEGPTDAVEMIRGSGDFSGAADITLFLRARSGQPGTFTIEHGKNRLGLEHQPIVARIVSEDGVSSIEYESDVATTEDMVEHLLERAIQTLSEHARFMQRQEIAENIGVKSQQQATLMGRALKLGQQRGVITRRKIGRAFEFILTSDDLALDSDAVSSQDDDSDDVDVRF